MNFRFVKGILTQIIMFIGVIPKYLYFSKQGLSASKEEIHEVIKNHTKKSLKSIGVNVNVEGYENLPEEGNVLFIANHSNWADGFILPSILDRPTGMIIAKEAQWDKFSMIDSWLKLFNCIYIDRSNNRKGLESIKKATDILKNTSSIGVFPEGCVTRSDVLGEFKDGVFRMAIKAQVPVIPIAIKNSKDIYVPTGRWYGKLNKATVDVTILPPIMEHLNNVNMKTKELSKVAHEILSNELTKK